MSADERRDRAGWLTPRQAAERLGVTDRTVVNRLRAGALTGVQLPNGRWRVDPTLAGSTTRPVVPVDRTPPLTAPAAGEDVATLLEVAMLRAENTELRARTAVLQARIAELERDVERFRRTGRRLLDGYLVLYADPADGTASGAEDPF